VALNLQQRTTQYGLRRYHPSTEVSHHGLAPLLSATTNGGITYITTNYSSVINNALDDQDALKNFIAQDFRVVLTGSRIVSTRLFEPEIFK
jgi:hypothetical protein